jgi:AAA family ATP:ADP antiporter
MPSSTIIAEERPSILDWLLRPFSRVRPGEGIVAALMLACVFLILTSYYLLKTAREGMILSGSLFGLRGEELKSYAGGAMAVLLVAILPLYDAIAARVRRIRLVNISYALVIACLLVFFALAEAGVAIGLAFFVWIGIVNLFLVAQFWSYANDVYTEEQGKRLFAIIAIGGSLGAIVGPQLARLSTTYPLLLWSAALFGAALALFNLVERVHARAPDAARTAEEPIRGSGGFALLLRDRYVLVMAAMVLVAAVVKTTGEFVLSSAATHHAAQLVPQTAHAELAGAAHDAAIQADRREVIKAFYGSFFSWVNLASFLLQAFAVSRIIQKLGVRRALFVMPVIALGAYAAIALVGGVALIRGAKVAENGTEYSVQNTVRQALFLPTDRAVKYKAKAAIDTLVVRAGDTVSALVVWSGIHLAGLDARGIAATNVVLVALWIVLRRRSGGNGAVTVTVGADGFFQTRYTSRMDFGLDQDQQLIVETVRRFAERDLRAWAPDADRAAAPPDRLAHAAGELGFFSDAVPTDAGGLLDGPYSHVARALRGFELGRGCAALAALLECSVEPALATAAWGSAEAKAALFSSLTSGGTATFVHDSRGALALDGDRLTGKLGPAPGLAIAAHVLVATGDVLALIPTAGLPVAPLAPSGWRAARWATLALDGYRIPDGFVLRGGSVADVLAWARTSLAARACGVAVAAMEHARAYAAERVQFGQPIGRFESLIRLRDDALTTASAARLLALQAAWQLDARHPDAHDTASRARVIAGDAVARATIDAVQIFGGYGFVNDYPVEKLMRDARAFEALHGDERLGRVLAQKGA